MTNFSHFKLYSTTIDNLFFHFYDIGTVRCDFLLRISKSFNNKTMVSAWQTSSL